MSRLRVIGVMVALLVAGAIGLADIRLHTGNPANKLFWSNGANVGLTINSTGSDNIPDDSHFTAIRNAYEAWNEINGSFVQIVENTSPVQQARTDW